MNAHIYQQLAKTAVADRLLAAERDRTARAARAARQDSQPPVPRGAVVARRVRALARLRMA